MDFAVPDPKPNYGFDPQTLMGEIINHADPNAFIVNCVAACPLAARFADLEFSPECVTDVPLFMELFFKWKSCLVVERKLVDGRYRVVGHRFLNPKKK